MKKHLLTLAALWLACPAVGGIRLLRSVDPCPQSFEDWVKRRDKMLNRFGIMAGKSNDSVGRWAQEVLDHYKGCHKENPALFANNPGIDQCWGPVNDWLRALAPFKSARSGPLYDDEDEEKVKNEPSWKLGMNKSDAEYYARTSKYTAIPEDIGANQAFLHAIAKPNNLPAAYAELDKINEARKTMGKPAIEYAPFKGNVKASGSGTLVRLMLYEPGNPAKWFSVGLPSDDGTRTPQWSAIAVVKNGEKSDVYFKDHWRKYNGPQDSHFQTSFEEVKEGKFSDACWKCHKSGLLKLPVDPSMAEGDRKKTEAFNKRIAETGLSGSGGYYDFTKLGPGLGGDPNEEPGLNELREKLFPYCVADAVEYDGDARKYKKEDYDNLSKAIDKRKILDAMNCSTCHDGVQRGPLTVPFGDILFRYIDEHRMPPGSPLTVQEIKVLKVCLEKEFSGMADAEEYRRLYNDAGEGTLSGGPAEKWYRGFEGLPEVKGLTPGRFARAFLKNSCTPKGAPTVAPQAAPGPSTDPKAHIKNSP